MAITAKIASTVSITNDIGTGAANSGTGHLGTARAEGILFVGVELPAARTL